jgi:hypothetical protein
LSSFSCNNDGTADGRYGDSCMEDSWGAVLCFLFFHVDTISMADSLVIMMVQITEKLLIVSMLDLDYGRI